MIYHYLQSQFSLLQQTYEHTHFSQQSPLHLQQHFSQHGQPQSQDVGKPHSQDFLLHGQMEIIPMVAKSIAATAQIMYVI